MADADDEIRGASIPHLSFALVIAGFDTRFVSHSGWPSEALPVAAGNYTDHECLTYASPLGGRLDVAEGIAEYDSITIELATLGAGAMTEDDPGRLLGRIGYRDATNHARLITEIAEATATPATIEVDRDVSGWTLPGLVHIGAETFTVNAAAGVGSEANPYRFTGIGRARRATAPQRHSVNGITRPWVVSEPVFWRWRRCTLYARAVRPDGGFGDMVEVMRGFLNDAPHIDGATVSVDMLPLTAILDRKVSGARDVVRLVSTHHYTEGSAASVFEHAQQMPEASYWATTTAAAAQNSTELHAATSLYDRLFDITLDVAEPRHGRLVAVGMNEQAPIAITDPTEFELAAGQPSAAAGVTADTAVTNPALVDLYQVEVVTPDAGEVSLLAWPEDYLDLLADWAPGTKDGAAGSWADVRIDETQSAIIARPNIEVQKQVNLVFSGGNSWPQAVDLPADRVGVGLLLHYPIDFAEPGDPVHTPPLAEIGLAGPRWTRVVSVRGDVAIPIRGVCPGGWYQSGERYILADGPVIVPSIGAASVRITYYDRGRGEERTATCRIVSSTSLATGYALEVHQDDRASMPSFGDWGDAEPVRIVPVVRFDALSPRDVLLTVLHSNGGNLATDTTWDREIFGAGLLTADVDRASFSAQPSPPGLDRWSPLIEPGASLRDLVEPILKATSTALVMRRDAQGRCRLTRIAVGLENPLESALSVGADEWVAEPWASTSTDRRITNRYELTTNHGDGGAGDAEVTLNFEDSASIAANGDGETLKVEMRGVYVDGRDPSEAIAIFRDMVARWSEIAGYARKRWNGSIGIGKGWRVGLGTTITVSSPLLRGAGAEFGVENAAAVVAQFKIPLWPGDGDAVDLGMLHHGVKTTAWAPALQVASVVNATTVTVTQNYYAPDEHPITGGAIQDLDFFSVGDDVHAVQRYNQDTFATVAINSINTATRKIIFDGAHGLTALAGYGTIEPAAYDDQSTTIALVGFTHRQLATIADSDGLLGTDDDAGFTLL